MTKIAIVTGAASGIGKAVVERFAEEDISSIILDIDESGGKNVAAEIQQRRKQATFMRLDVTNEIEVQSVFEKIKSAHGRVDILVNVAGGSMHRHPLEEFTLAHWQAVIDVNLTSTFLCCRAVTRLMKAQKSGAIVNISSDIGFSGDANRVGLCSGQSGNSRPDENLGPGARALWCTRQRCGTRTHRYSARARHLFGRRVGSRCEKNSHGPCRRAGRRG